MTSTAVKDRYRVGDLDLTRVGYGAMQLAGPGVFGPPKDHDAAIAVLRTAVDLGINHIDTADFYGPYVTNALIREALAPYPDDLHIVTKVGARRDERGGWPHARTPAELREQVHDNLRHLGLDVLDVVNLRVGGFEEPEPGSIAEQFTALAELQQQGLIRHLGVSTVNAEQLAEAQAIAPVVCVQNIVQHRPPRRRRARRPDRARRASRSCPTSRSAASTPCSPTPSRPSRTGSAPRRWPPRWPGCCAARPTSC